MPTRTAVEGLQNILREKAEDMAVGAAGAASVLQRKLNHAVAIHTDIHRSAYRSGAAGAMDNLGQVPGEVLSGFLAALGDRVVADLAKTPQTGYSLK